MDRKRIAIGLGVLALAIAAFVTRGFGLVPSGDGDALRLYGNVDIREVDMAFRVPGRIDTVVVEEGDKVARGALLATIDPAPIDARAQQAEASVAQARAALAKLQNGNRPQDIAQAQARVAAAQAAAGKAREDVERRRPLVEPGAISRQLWEQSLAERDSADARLAEAREALSLARTGARAEDIAAAQAQLEASEAARRGVSTDLGDTRLVAKAQGTVVTRAREPGAMVQPGETVLTISLDRPLRVRAYVSETDLSRIAPGMAVTVRADGNPRAYRGTIGYISPRAEFTPKSVETENLRTDLVYRLRITVENPDNALRQGQPVTVSVTGAKPARD
ncbi:HlyD family efflux transporter periplasmic adaptor subunit [Novosphingobium album (ex Liu et al. 2023)]|uniref:HlyD family efflux transporter periplasmic adaptor subunit n=1 Tax=Novosphingobium album (ex Liu et al. 2023) TaxID=3031130 RepID=A0ABT5WR96_9SPHN|nr:HlyD family efflux transporter periplasmic adaptor subunit [Novosphingobium album (ex Liu et al. 2023)]MDE8652562.1 HlyD family efflux transporter periplasmic adaptor subunit [Novosphingobium album (ex Liu et al. 2023)]